MTKEIEMIFSHFKKMQTVYFSTVEFVQPRVRPVTLLYYDSKFYIATGTDDAKMKQIATNPCFEFCFSFCEGENTGYIRAAGKIKIIKDSKIKKKIYDEYEFISFFWKSSDNPGFSLLKLDVKQLEFMKPGEYNASKHKLK